MNLGPPSVSIRVIRGRSPIYFVHGFARIARIARPPSVSIRVIRGLFPVYFVHGFARIARIARTPSVSIRVIRGLPAETLPGQTHYTLYIFYIFYTVKEPWSPIRVHPCYPQTLFCPRIRADSPPPFRVHPRHPWTFPYLFCPRICTDCTDSPGRLFVFQ